MSKKFILAFLVLLSAMAACAPHAEEVPPPDSSKLTSSAIRQRCRYAFYQMRTLAQQADQQDRAEIAARKHYDVIRESVTQVDARNLAAGAEWLSRRDEALKLYNARLSEYIKTSSLKAQLMGWYRPLCTNLPSLPPPAPVAAPLGFTQTVRVENLGNRIIQVALVSESAGANTTCDIEKIPSGDAVDLNLYSYSSGGLLPGCNGSLELAMHNSQDIVYYRVSRGSIYQIIWNGKVWDLRIGNRE